MGKSFVGSKRAAGGVDVGISGIRGGCSGGVDGNSEDEMIGRRGWGAEIEETEVGVRRDRREEGGVMR